jgi:hypothetical protein
MLRAKPTSEKFDIELSQMCRNNLSFKNLLLKRSLRESIDWFEQKYIEREESQAQTIVKKCLKLNSYYL